jgi:drug/metabolite transporter (DMT)-like permease
VSRRYSALLVALAAIWGAVYPLTTIALHGYPSAWVIAGRALSAAVVLLPVAWTTGALRPLMARPWRAVTAGLLQAAVPLTLLTLGQQHVSAGLAGILSSAQPLFVALLVMALDRTPRPRETLGVLLGAAGIVLLFLHDLDSQPSSLAGGVAVLGAAAFFAAGAVYIHRALPATPPHATATAAMCLTCLLTTPAALAGPRPTHPAWTATASLVALGLVGTAVGLAVFYFLIQAVGPTRAALAWYLAPAFAVTYDIPLSGPPPATAVVGLALIIAGSAVAATNQQHRRIPEVTHQRR